MTLFLSPIPSRCLLYLSMVLRTFENAVKLQFQKATAKIENEKKQLFRLVLRRISAKAIEHIKDVYNRFLLASDEKPPIPPLCRYNSLVSLRLLLTRYSYSRILSKYAGEDAPKALGTLSAAKAPK
ncbi:hypothetical protein PENARI_c036G03197 [Penicillium arizonense]|uniref:Uncharacterized protein n=1 Tax=Penicillium arizonense TaxID=1835702 RepID=A0A1F5L4K0_PENAI|nr:hypothetical protein PENARI_c036G03197 [Penicillium arizonense]OGE47841.1 hypothetical protein PENARI_c036G03197 [Penicillium arizonense]